MIKKDEMDTELFTEHQQSPPHNMKLGGVSTNTYVSISIFAMGLAGFWAVMNTIYGAKADISTRLDKSEWNQGQFMQQVTELRTEINQMRDKKQTAETWSDRDMFKWSAHLQRDNPSIKVPEPEMHTQ